MTCLNTKLLRRILIVMCMASLSSLHKTAIAEEGLNGGVNTKFTAEAMKSPEESRVDDILNQSHHLRTVRKYRQAADILKQAKQFITALPLAKQAEVYCELSEVYDELNEPNRARMILKRADRVLSGSAPESINKCALHLSTIYNRDGCFSKSELIYRRWLNDAERAGCQEKELLDPLTWLARSLSQQGKEAEAGMYFQRAISICERAQKQDDVRTALVLIEWADHCTNFNQFAEAEYSYNRALNKLKKCFSISPKTDPISTKVFLAPRLEHLPYPETQLESSILNNLGILYAKQSRLAEARHCYDSALAALHGPKESETVYCNSAAILNNEACLVASIQDNSSRAEQLFIESITIKRNCYDRDVRSLLLSELNYSDFLESTGQKARAKCLRLKGNHHHEYKTFAKPGTCRQI